MQLWAFQLGYEPRPRESIMMLDKLNYGGRCREHGHEFTLFIYSWPTLLCICNWTDLFIILFVISNSPYLVFAAILWLILAVSSMIIFRDRSFPLKAIAIKNRWVTVSGPNYLMPRSHPTSMTRNVMNLCKMCSLQAPNATMDPGTKRIAFPYTPSLLIRAA